MTQDTPTSTPVRPRGIRRAIACVAGTTLLALGTYAASLFATPPWLNAIILTLNYPVAFVNALLPEGTLQDPRASLRSFPDPLGDMLPDPDYWSDALRPGPWLLEHVLVAVPTYLAIVCGYFMFRRLVKGKCITTRVFVWLSAVLAVFLIVPSAAALRVLMKGPSIDCTWSQECNAILMRVPSKREHLDLPFRVVREVGKWEGQSLARRDFEGGQIRFFGNLLEKEDGTEKIYLEGIEAYEDEVAIGKRKWGCVVSFSRRPTGEIASHVVRIGEPRPTSPAVTLAPGESELICLDDGGQRVHFRAPILRRVRLRLAPHMKAYNKTMLLLAFGKDLELRSERPPPDAVVPSPFH